LSKDAKETLENYAHNCGWTVEEQHVPGVPDKRVQYLSICSSGNVWEFGKSEKETLLDCNIAVGDPTTGVSTR